MEYILKNTKISQGSIINKIHDDNCKDTHDRDCIYDNAKPLFNMFDYNEYNDDEYKSIESLLQRSQIDFRRMPIYQYRIIKNIGKGGNGIIFLADIHREKFVIKMIRMRTPDYFKKSINEMKIFYSIDHQNIAKYFGYDYNYNIEKNIENQRIFYIIMENIFPTKNIIENVSMLPNYTRQIIEALQYIHSNNIVHMDIKKENILLTIPDIIKIIDFGESHFISDFTDQVSGSISHMAPELMNGTYNKNYIHLCDIWSLGITICDIYLGNKINSIYQKLLEICKSGLNLSKYEFYKKMIFYEIYLKNMTDIKIRFDIFSRIEIEDFLDATRKTNTQLHIFCDFINKCLHVDYRIRWNADQLLDHPYLLSIK